MNAPINDIITIIIIKSLSETLTGCCQRGKVNEEFCTMLSGLHFVLCNFSCMYGDKVGMLILCVCALSLDCLSAVCLVPDTLLVLSYIALLRRLTVTRTHTHSSIHYLDLWKSESVLYSLGSGSNIFQC